MDAINKKTISELRKDIEIDLTVDSVALRLKTTYGLFSPKEVDPGTKLLLERFPYEEIKNPKKILDMGSGYGVIGLYLAKRYPKAEVTLIDKDSVALEYAEKNAKLNRIHNVKIYGSNMFSKVEEENFDCIVSNIPAKVGNELLHLFFYDAKRKLGEKGMLVTVTISGLKEYMKRNGKNFFGNYEKIKQNGTHIVHVSRK